MPLRTLLTIACLKNLGPTLCNSFPLMVRGGLCIIARGANPRPSLADAGIRVTARAGLSVTRLGEVRLPGLLISSVVPLPVIGVGAGFAKSVPIPFYPVQRVPFLAMCFGGILGALGSAAKSVRPGCHRLKVRGVYAEFHTAEMIELEAGGNIPHYNGVGDAMRGRSPNHAVMSPRILPVLVMAQPASPEPAVPAFVHALPKIRKKSLGKIDRLVGFPHLHILPEVIRPCPLC